MITNEDILNRITINPDICHGKPTIRNKRYTVESILEYLAGGDSIDELLSEFKDLEKDDILACFTFAWKMLQNKTIKLSNNEVLA